MLRRYTEINKQIVANYPSVPYIDMRQAFLNAIPRTYYGYTGCLTIDGEHENENGSIIVAKMFSDQLLSWLLMGAAWGGNERGMGLRESLPETHEKEGVCMKAHNNIEWPSYLLSKYGTNTIKIKIPTS